MLKLELGHDTEYFIMDPDGKPVPAHSVGIPPKESAIKVTETGSFVVGQYFRDGYAVEVNSLPGVCRGYLFDDHRVVVDAILDKLPSGYYLSTTPAVDIDIKALRENPETPEDVKTFGCSPTFNAYTGKKNRITTNALNVPFRTIAAHFHFGFREEFFPEAVEKIGGGPEEVSTYIKLADFLIGIPGTFLSPQRELEYQRRSLYGKAGEFRIHYHPTVKDDIDDEDEDYAENKKGKTLIPSLEYRVLSTLMVRHSSLASFAPGVFRDVIAPIGHLDEVASLLSPAFQQDVQDAINEGKNLDSMMREWVKFTTILCEVYRTKIGTTCQGDHVFYDCGIPSFSDWERMRDYSNSYYEVHIQKGHRYVDGHHGFYSGLMALI